MFFVFYSKMQIEQKERKKYENFQEKIKKKNISDDNEYQELKEKYEKVKMANQIEFESLLNSGNISKEKMFEIISYMYSEEKELKEKLENLKNKN